jgi:ankyrin repeat protein
VGIKVRPLAGLWALGWLCAVGGTRAAEPDLRLVNAVAEQDKPAIRALLQQRLDVNAARVDGVTALLWAAHFNDLDTVELLLRAGANVNAADDHGVTPLSRAAENASAAMVERLLAAGANPNLAQTSGLTPLMIATHTGNVAVVKLLLARGADLNAATVELQDTALMWAVADERPEIARLLIEGGANVRAASKRGFTPLMLAARNGDIAMARMLIAAGVSVNELAPDGTHVLPFAIVAGQGPFAMFLLEQGADPNGGMAGMRALHTAAGGVDLWMSDWNRRHGGTGGIIAGFTLNTGPRDGLELVKALLARGADPNAQITTSAMLMNYVGYPKKGAFEGYACGTGDLRGATPLWIAAYTANGIVGDAIVPPELAALMGGNKRSGDIIRTLLAAGADQRIATDDGTTPLMVAAGLGRATFQPGLQRGMRSPGAEEAVKLLLDAPGADVNAINEADFTALHGAAFRGLNEVIQILVERGANINARDFRGRTPYRLAEGSKQSFQFQAYPETARFIASLGANTRLGVPGIVQERNRDVAAAAAANEP